MADLRKIIDIGMAIKEAIQTARRNKRECRSIERVVDRVCGLVHTLSVSPAPMLQHPILAGILDDVWESLSEALVLVQDCGKKRSLFQLITAKSTAKKLSSVRNDLLQKMALGTMAITTVTALGDLLVNDPACGRTQSTVEIHELDDAADNNVKKLGQQQGEAAHQSGRLGGQQEEEAVGLRQGGAI